MKNNIEGIIIVNKDLNQTSRDVVNKLCDFFGTKQIGHAGTLDPIATGILVICIGRATKLTSILTGHDKEYIAKMKLGITTDTYDITGKILTEIKPVITEESIKEALNNFLGNYEQEVPIYSAVKINGKKLYQYARDNENIALPKRNVSIKSIELIEINNYEVTFKCLVSKGTYIRSLINDLGSYLGCGATMMSLQRVKQGEFNLTDAVTLEEVFNNQYKLISIAEIFNDMPKEIVSADKLKLITNGSIISKDFSTKYKLYYENTKLIAIYEEYHKDSTMAKPFLML